MFGKSGLEMDMCNGTDFGGGVSQDNSLLLPRSSISLYMKCKSFDTMAVAKPLASSHGRKILCQVCGALSSGLHFGVFTCEGCKCFYRRSIREGANYACAKDRGCDITMETRNSCRYCRFQKCLTLGMSKEGIKLGRRPKVECEPLHQVYFRHNDPNLPTMAPATPSIPSQQWPHLAPVIQIKTEMSDECGFYASKPSPYRQAFSIKQEPEESLYGTSYQCQFGEHLSTSQYRSRVEPSPNAVDQWHDQASTTIRWKSEGHRHNINPYFDNSSDIPACQPALAWTPMQASPADDSGRGSAEPLHWEDSGGTPTSLNIPEVQTGAIAAMAFANLYRDTTEGSSQRDSTKTTYHNSDRNNNNEGEATNEDQNQKSYIELLPRGKPEENSPCEETFSDGNKVKGQWMCTQSKILMTQLPSADFDSPKRATPQHDPHNFQSFCNQDSNQRKRSHSCTELLERKKSKVTKESWTSENTSGIYDILHDLSTAFMLMQRDILQVYVDYRREKSETGSNTTPEVEADSQYMRYEFSEEFCQQKRDQLKQAIQNFVKFLEDKNSDWISTNVSDHIPVSFITKICLLHESSKRELKQQRDTDVSTEEAACLTTLSLIYDKRLSKDGESINPEKQKLTNDIRDVLKGKGFGSQKLQNLLEQKHQNNILT